MSRLEIDLLGSLQVRLDGKPVQAMRSDKVRALLAYLLVESDRPQRREKLAGLLWPGYPEESARASLRRALADLRLAIDDEGANPPYLEITRQTTQFDRTSNAWADVLAFHRLARNPATIDAQVIAGWEEAAALYHGEFMEGFSLPDSPEFEGWLLLNREQLKRQALETLGRLAECLGERGEHQRGLEHAWRAVEIDPLRESAHRQVMRLLALSGRRQEAIAQYEACARILGAELGVEPSGETRHLYEQILKEEWPPAASPETAPTIKPPSVIGACPYRGLAAFREQDAPFFFGRERFAQNLLEAIQTNKAAAIIIGSSGSGKSSVAYAGLIPKLRTEGDWLVVQLRPSVSPFHSLSGAILPLLEPTLSETDWLIEGHKLAAALADGSLPLLRLTARVLEKNPASTRLLLFIDQFEELYSLCPQPETQRSFLDTLLDCIDAHREQRNPTILLLTMRADFMGQALDYRPFADLLQTSSLMLGPMRRDELQTAIEKPAEVQGATFEPGLVQRILDDVGEGPGNLPLLEFALTLLWERVNSGWLTHAGYESIGEVQGALARYAEQAYGELDDHERENAQRVFLQLIRPGEGTQDTRRLATRAEIGEASWPLVQLLADKRLVVTGRDASGAECVEIVHEALIASWERLRSWIEVDRTFRTWQEDLRISIRQWEASGRDEGTLLRGAPLAEAEGWLGTHSVDLSERESDFIRACVDLRERKAALDEALRQRELQYAQQLARSERRRRNILLAFAGVLSLAVIVAFILTGFALRQRQEALVAYSASLAANAQQALDDGDVSTALALALSATTTNQPSLQAQRVLLNAAYSPGARKRFEITRLFQGAVGPATANAIAPNGETVLIGLEEGTLIIWDMPSGKEVARLHGHSAKINDITIDSNGKRAVSVGNDAQAIIWDILAARELGRFKGHSGPVKVVDISQDGRFVVTGGFSSLGWEHPGELILWELESGEEIHRLTGHIAGVVAAKFCLEDHAILSSSGDAELFSSVGATDQPSNSAMIRDMLLWDVEDGETIQNYKDMEHDAFTISISPDGDQALVGSYYEGVISRYDITTGEHLAALKGHEDSVRTVSYSSDGRIGVSGSADGNLILWDLLGGKPITKFAVHTGEVLDLALAPDGRTAISSARDGTLILWDLTDAAEVRRFSGHGDMVYDVAVIHGQDQLISVSGSVSINRPTLDTSLRLWEIETGEQLNSLAVPIEAIMQVAVSPDSRTSLFVGAGPLVHSMDLKSWKEYGQFEGHLSYIPCIEFLPDGKRALSCSVDGTLILWDVQKGIPIYRLDGRAQKSGVWAVAISPDGKTALSDTSYGTMILWNLENGEELRTLRGEDPSGWTGASGIAYLPDGRTAISVGGDGQIIQWNLETGKEIRHIGQHPSLRTRVVITPDGRLALTGGMDGILMLWDLETGALIRRSDGHGVIFDLTMSEDSQTAFFGSSDTTVVQWQLSNPTVAELRDWIGANRYVRPLSCNERELYQVKPLCESKQPHIP